MSNYSLPPPLPTYHVLLEGEGLGQSLGNCKDDLLNVCMRHVEKMCKADLSRNFIERNHMENGRSSLVYRSEAECVSQPIPATRYKTRTWLADTSWSLFIHSSDTFSFRLRDSNTTRPPLNWQILQRTLE